MPLRVVLIDLSKTLVRDDGSVVPDMPELIAELRGRRLKVAVVTNESAASAGAVLRRLGCAVDLVVGRDSVKARKPSPRFCEHAAEVFGVPLHETLYLGDDDKTDALCCANAKVLYLAAKWGNATPKYGLAVESPHAVLRFVGRHLLEDPVWYWQLDTRDGAGKGLVVRSLWPEQRGFSNLKGVMKFERDPRQGKLSLRGFYFRHLLSALYLGGHLRNVDYWTWYPSSDGRAKSAAFQDFLAQASRLFKDRHLENLLVRHTPSQKSHKVRFEGGDPGFLNQANTVCLNPDWSPADRRRLEGKRILLLDDFCTAGYSFECGRNFLLMGGAAQVECVSFGRYHDEYNIVTPRPGLRWDAWKPRAFSAVDFRTEVKIGVKNPGAQVAMDRALAMEFPDLSRALR